MTEVERLIWARWDCNKANNSFESSQIAIDFTKEQLTKHKKKYKHRQRFGVGQSSRSGARGLEPAKSQEPIAEALKIQKVQEFDIGR